jgi:hypothetical protein
MFMKNNNNGSCTTLQQLNNTVVVLCRCLDNLNEAFPHKSAHGAFYKVENTSD